MARYTRKEFAELIGLGFNKDGRAKIATWIKRGNIILDGEYIDDTNQQNAYWIQRQKEKSNESKKNGSNPVELEAKEKESTISEGEKEKDKAAYSPSGRSRSELEIEKKEREIEKLKVDTRIQEIKEHKMRGEVIPIDLIKNIFSQNNQSIVVEFKNSVDNMLSIIAKKKSLNGNEVAEIRGQLVSVINFAVDKAIEYSRKNIQSIQKEFAIKKNIGEHE